MVWDQASTITILGRLDREALVYLFKLLIKFNKNLFIVLCQALSCLSFYSIIIFHLSENRENINFLTKI